MQSKSLGCLLKLLSKFPLEKELKISMTQHYEQEFIG